MSVHEEPPVRSEEDALSEAILARSFNGGQNTMTRKQLRNCIMLLMHQVDKIIVRFHAIKRSGIASGITQRLHAIGIRSDQMNRHGTNNGALNQVMNDFAVLSKLFEELSEAQPVA